MGRSAGGTRGGKLHVSMAFFHFLTCVLLAYAPSFVVYKATSLSDYNPYVACGYAALGFLATQFVKMLLIATIVPEVEEGADEGGFELSYEVLKSLAASVDVLGVFLLLRWRLIGRSMPDSVRRLVIGVSWATTDSLLRHLLPLWVGARGIEFSWEYMAKAIEANLSIPMHIAMVGLVWLWMRQDHPAVRNAALSLLVGHAVFPSVLVFMSSIGLSRAWSVVWQGAATAVMYVAMSYLDARYHKS